jgi:hypothetical protein
MSSSGIESSTNLAFSRQMGPASSLRRATIGGIQMSPSLRIDNRTDLLPASVYSKHAAFRGTNAVRSSVCTCV